MTYDIKVNVLRFDEEIVAYNRSALFIGPDNNKYEVAIAYAGEWTGYVLCDWFDEHGNAIDTPEWADELDYDQIDELILGETVEVSR